MALVYDGTKTLTLPGKLPDMLVSDPDISALTSAVRGVIGEWMESTGARAYSFNELQFKWDMSNVLTASVSGNMSGEKIRRGYGLTALGYSTRSAGLNYTRDVVMFTDQVWADTGSDHNLGRMERVLLADYGDVFDLRARINHAYARAELVRQCNRIRGSLGCIGGVYATCLSNVQPLFRLSPLTVRAPFFLLCQALEDTWLGFVAEYLRVLWDMTQVLYRSPTPRLHLRGMSAVPGDGAHRNDISVGWVMSPEDAALINAGWRRLYSIAREARCAFHGGGLGSMTRTVSREKLDLLNLRMRTTRTQLDSLRRRDNE